MGPPSTKESSKEADRGSVVQVAKEKRSTQRSVAGPLLSSSLIQQLRKEEEELTEKSGLVIRKRKKANKPAATKRGKDEPKVEYNFSDTAKYAMWVPPEDQSGDGKTSLNKKLGY